MIGIDTNILTRYLVQDDPVQSRIAGAFLSSLTRDNPGIITIPVLLELTWILRSKHKMDRNGIVQIIQSLLVNSAILFQRRDLVENSLQLYIHGKADYSDCFITMCGMDTGCNQVMTFDRIAARDAGMTLLT